MRPPRPSTLVVLMVLASNTAHLSPTGDPPFSLDAEAFRLEGPCVPARIPLVWSEKEVRRYATMEQ